MNLKILALSLAILPSAAFASAETKQTVNPIYDAVNTAPPVSKQQIFDQIVFTSQWVRQPSATSVNTAAYFKLTNNTDKDIILTEVVSEDGVCERTEIHGYKNDDQVKKMFKLESVMIPAKTTLEFAPGGFHVMLMGLRKPLAKDYMMTLKFKFSYIGETNSKAIPLYPVTFPVK